jgi:hypothetical protein
MVLDHAKLDATEAAKAAGGGGGRGGAGGGGGGGLLSGLLGMTAEEVMGAMVAAAVERCVGAEHASMPLGTTGAATLNRHLLRLPQAHLPPLTYVYVCA